MQNEHLQRLYTRLMAKYSLDSEAMAMGDWICKNTTLRGKPFSFARYPFQEQITNDMHPRLVCEKISQVGLALALDTLVPTPTGWTTMGSIQVGDQVFDEKGRVCDVEYVSPVFRDRVCYEVKFDTGEAIVADADHRWFVQCDRMFNEEGLHPGSGRIPNSEAASYAKAGVLRTKQLAAWCHKGGRNLFAIPNTQPLEGHADTLPVDPYFLGLWLGDGSSSSTYITGVEADLHVYREELERRGFECSFYEHDGKTSQMKVEIPRDRNLCPRGHDKRVEGTVGEWKRCKKCRDQDLRYHGQVEREHSFPYDTMHSRLSNIGVLKNKHIPEMYLRASEGARRDLLRGLLDTDGSITKNGRTSFYNTSIDLVLGVQELAASLGLKYRTRWRSPSTSTMSDGKVINAKLDVAEVSFVAYVEDRLFGLPRKSERLRRREDGRSTEALRRRIVEVTEVPTVPTRCISVNSPSHLFLAGRGMIPTHNTETQIRKALAVTRRKSGEGVNVMFTLPTDDLFEKVSGSRVKTIIDKDAVFNLEEDAKAIRNKNMYQFGHSFLYMVGATESDATSTSVDYMFNDEVDLTKQAMLALFSSRLQNSDFKVRQQFSTPTFTGYGINSLMALSDYHEYMIKCSCGHWQVPTFSRQFVQIPGLPLSIENLMDIERTHVPLLDLNNAEVVCERCSRPLDLDDYESREWVPKHENMPNRGYKVRPFSTHRLGINYIIGQLLDYKQNNFLRGFKNTVLGEADEGGQARISQEEIDAAFTKGQSRVPEISKGSDVFVGIDVGQICTVITGRGTCAEDIDPIRIEFVHIDDLIKHVEMLKGLYNIASGAMDRHPYEPTAREVWKVSDGRIWPVEYRGSKEINPVFDVEKNLTHFQVDRTTVLDRVQARFKSRTISLNGWNQDHRQIIGEHFRNMVRKEEPEVPAVWEKLDPADHSFHAMAFMLTAPSLPTVIALYNKVEVRSTIGIIGVDDASSTARLPGYSAPQNNSLRIIRTSVYG